MLVNNFFSLQHNKEESSRTNGGEEDVENDGATFFLKPQTEELRRQQQQHQQQQVQKPKRILFVAIINMCFACCKHWWDLSGAIPILCSYVASLRVVLVGPFSQIDEQQQQREKQQHQQQQEQQLQAVMDQLLCCRAAPRCLSQGMAGVAAMVAGCQQQLHKLPLQLQVRLIRVGDGERVCVLIKGD